MNNQTPEFLTPAQVVTRWNNAVTIGTLANWRASKPKKGPPFQKFGTRVRYPLAGLVEYEAKGLHLIETPSNDNPEPKADAA